MTPAELKRGIEALRIRLEQLGAGERVAYWHLLELLDMGSTDLSRSLDEELRRLERAGKFVLVEEDGQESFVMRRAVKRPAAARAKPKPARKPVTKKKAVTKKRPAAKKKARK